MSQCCRLVPLSIAVLCWQDRGWIPHQGWPDLRRGSQDGDKEAERAAQGPAGGGPAGGPAPGGHHPANGDLDRVQGMFPSDALLLYDDNPLAMVCVKTFKIPHKTFFLNFFIMCFEFLFLLILIEGYRLDQP